MQLEINCPAITLYSVVVIDTSRLTQSLVDDIVLMS